MKTAIIIGAGPAGLTAAYELLTKTDIVPIIIEADKQAGGLSKTIHYHGNKIDIGGHRFFSKSKKIIDWWLRFLPLENSLSGKTVSIQYHNQQSDYDSAPAQVTGEKVMLLRKRKSRVFFRKKLFDYPLQLNFRTLRKLGLVKTMQIGYSYLYAKLFPRKPELNLEDFFINRFGKNLYKTFFKDYTEKVWGVPCDKIPASWGQQRIRNLNVGKLILHSARSVFSRNTRLDQKGTHTSLIEQFLYPKFGPGQMWETVAEEILKRKGIILLNTKVTAICGDKNQKILSVETTDVVTGKKTIINGDYFFSTMPVKELIENSRDLHVPAETREIASSLEYRDFLIVGILADRLLLKEKNGEPVTDNWIYVQDKNIKAGRLQFFHNWSPFMIAQPDQQWIGVEYFCNETDAFWQLPDKDLADQAIGEMESIGVLESSAVKDTVVIKVKKAYPSYYGSYKDFNKVQDFLNSITNLFPVGRNGMHRYNNSDHSMLTAMEAVDNIIAGRWDKSNIWEINTEEDYHEDSNILS